LTTNQAAPVAPSAVQSLAQHVEQRDAGMVDRMSALYAAHPTLVKTLGTAAIVMALMDKYSDVFKLANEIGLKNPDVKEEGGQLKIKGETEYELDKDRLWNKIKEHSGWESEVQADLRSGRSDVYGVYRWWPETRCRKSPRYRSTSRSNFRP